MKGVIYGFLIKISHKDVMLMREKRDFQIMTRYRRVLKEAGCLNFKAKGKVCSEKRASNVIYI